MRVSIRIVCLFLDFYVAIFSTSNNGESYAALSENYAIIHYHEDQPKQKVGPQFDFPEATLSDNVSKKSEIKDKFFDGVIYSKQRRFNFQT